MIRLNLGAHAAIAALALLFGISGDLLLGAGDGPAPRRRTRRIIRSAETPATVRLVNAEDRPPAPPGLAPDLLDSAAPRATASSVELLSDATTGTPAPPPPSEPLSAEAQGLSLDDLMSIALVNNPTLRQAAALVDGQRGLQIQAGLYPNPSAGYLGSEIGQDGSSGQQGGFVSQDFVMGGKLKLNQAVAGHAVNQAMWLREQQTYRVQNALRVRYYEILGAQRAVELAGNLKEIAENSAEVTSTLVKAGEKTRLDVLQAEIEVDQAQILLANGQNRREAVWKRLTAVMGVPNLPPSNVRGSLDEEIPEFEFDQTFEWLVANSPQMQAAQSAVARAQWAVERARVEPIPNVNLQFAQQYDNSTGYQISQVQAGVALPIFNRNQGNILAACAELRRAQDETQRLELSLRDRLAAAFQRYSNSRQQVLRYRGQIIPRARESLDISIKSYQRGELDYLQVLTIQRTYFQTNMAYVEALTQLWRSTVDLSGWLLTEESEGEAVPAAAEAVGAPIPTQP